MSEQPRPPRAFERQSLKVYPLSQRESLSAVEDILISPQSSPAPVNQALQEQINRCAQDIQKARARGASVMLIYGAHLLRNGACPLLEAMMQGGWITHLATNGAGTIHDFEYAHHGRSTESVQRNVAAGTFGAWEETGRAIMMALARGALEGKGYGACLGQWIADDGMLPLELAKLDAMIREEPFHPLASARVDYRSLCKRYPDAETLHRMPHPWKSASILAQAYKHGVPVSVHPGIGYDIITNHPAFMGSVLGRAAERDFDLFCEAVDRLDGGVVLSIGSAIMGPQVFEKSLSCVHNLRFQRGEEAVSGHSIYVVDLQDGGGWDWSQGEPPKTHPAYYLRFCKSFSRMGGRMEYLQCDNAVFTHRLQQAIQGDDAS